MNQEPNDDYYPNKLFALKLKRAYEIGSPRIQQYLEAEVQYTLSHIKSTDTVLELGCGYGRVLEKLADKASKVVGIDIAEMSLGRVSKGKKMLALTVINTDNEVPEKVLAEIKKFSPILDVKLVKF